jgi:hypothetical protein
MSVFPKRKYNNCTCFVDGIRFDSRREADYYGQLKLEQRAKLIKSFQRQISFALYAQEVDCDPDLASQKLIGHHKVDFLVTLLNGDQEVREVKGFATDGWNLRRKVFEANYPHIPYKVIK